MLFRLAEVKSRNEDFTSEGRGSVDVGWRGC